MRRNEREYEDRQGRVNTNQRHWLLVLHYSSCGPASGVDFEFLDLPKNALFRESRGEGPLGTIPDGQESPILAAAGDGVA